MTEVEICNSALLMLNKSPIGSLTDDGPIQAKYCKLAYPVARRSLISKYTWNFASWDGPLSPVKYLNFDEAHQPPFTDDHPRPDPGDPNTYKNLLKYSFLYALPENYLGLNTLYDADDTPIPTLPHRKPLYTIGHFIPPPGSEYNIAVGTYIFSDIGGLPTMVNELLVNPAPLKINCTIDIADTNLFPPSFVDCLIYSLALRLSKYLVDSLQYVQMLSAAFNAELASAIANDCQQLIIQNENPNVIYSF
ncbi:MAG: hypothetical protein LBB63_00905 [Holosporaceae bacterium]|jgi:hypothetical protein|nr:hypothetical protein [Holosporaceae bacterium]